MGQNASLPPLPGFPTPCYSCLQDPPRSSPCQHLRLFPGPLGFVTHAGSFCFLGTAKLWPSRHFCTRHSRCLRSSSKISTLPSLSHYSNLCSKATRLPRGPPRCPGLALSLPNLILILLPPQSHSIPSPCHFFTAIITVWFYLGCLRAYLFIFNILPTELKPHDGKDLACLILRVVSQAQSKA